eukprot:1139455-Pelagomonas_calceolata.AAC.1
MRWSSTDAHTLAFVHIRSCATYAMTDVHIMDYAMMDTDLVDGHECHDGTRCALMDTTMRGEHIGSCAMLDIAMLDIHACHEGHAHHVLCYEGHAHQVLCTSGLVP